MIILLLFVFFSHFLFSQEDKKIPKLDSLNNFEFIKEISTNDYNLIFKETELFFLQAQALL